MAGYAPYRRILVACDLTAASVRLTECARMLASALGADIELLHVVEPLAPTAPIPPESTAPAFIQTQQELFEAAQKHLAALASQPGMPKTRWSVEIGNTKSEILRLATEHHVDLIVVGAHRKHGLAALFGPTEDAMVHSARCDVLAVRVDG